jgi:hypothetical protein
MKRSITLKMMVFALVSLAITACSKYEEGSKFTVMTKKSRLVNEWNITKFTTTYSGVSNTETVTGMAVSIKKDNTYTMTYTSNGSSFSESGTWAFSDDKEKLIMTDADGDISTSTIVLLKNKEMKLKDVNGEYETITELAAQ